MKKWLLGIGTFALAFAMLVTPTDSKVMAAGTTVTSGDAGTTVTGGDAGTTDKKLETSLSWNDSWVASWTPVEGVGRYTVMLYKDGERVKAPATTNTEVDFSRYIDESGTYQFKIGIYSTGNPEELIGKMSEFSEEKVYVAPEKKLGTTIGYWDNSKLAVFNIPVVEDATAYELLIESEEGDQVRKVVHADTAKNGIVQYDFDDTYLADRFEGKVWIKVKALSGDINHFANGDFGEKSSAYTATWSLDYMTKYINEYLGWATGSSATEVMEGIESEEGHIIIDGKRYSWAGLKYITKYNLQAAMAESEDFRNLINDITKKYAEEKGIKEEAPTVSSAASAYIKAEDITVIGAAGNGNAGETVKLQVGISEEEVNIDSSLYKNYIKLDLKLMSNSTVISKLNVPVTIKMKAPVGMDASKLVILHYHTSSEAPEIITPAVDGDMISFSVSKFSTFVFAESVSDGNSGSIDGSTEGGSNGNNAGGIVDGSTTDDTTVEDTSDEEDDNEDDSEEESAEEAKPVKDNVPKTGDSLPIALPIAVTVIFAGAAVVLRKKVN